MCTTCGCSEDPSHVHDEHERIEIDVLAKSRRLADDNRGWLARRGVFMVNLMSAPGAGKTTLLERTVRELREELAIRVVEGDQATAFDADRVRAAGAEAVQVNTGAGCHLDPHMVRHGIEDLAPPRGGIVIVENVGNLVCPALFDLGEAARVVLLSVPEGDDKPLKYPHMFAAATIVLLTKTDLLPHVPFDVGRFVEAVRTVNARARIHEVSVLREAGLDGWYDLLRDGARRAGAPDEAAR